MKPLAVLVFATTVGLMCTGTTLADSCEPQWSTLGTIGELETVGALTTWDPDGPGPAPQSLIAGLRFATPGNQFLAQRVVRWTGGAWESLGSGIDTAVRAMTSWDPDGAGPASPWLVVGGDGFGVHAFDGQSWFALANAFNAPVYHLMAWDPDGSGPNPMALIAGGDFTTIDGESVPYIARWTGTTWEAVGDGFPFPVRALTQWDADGDPTTPELLVAGSSAMRIFDGVSWSLLDATDDDSPRALTTWDEDGDGPNPPVLYAGGRFDTTTTPKQYFVRWTGAAWQKLGVPISGTPMIEQLIAGDPDGPGPAPAGVLVASSMHPECTFWDGLSLRDWDAVIQGPVYACAYADPDGDGPLGPRLVIGGGSNLIAPRFRTEFGWAYIGPGVAGEAAAMTVWDPDGSGPLPPTAFTGGYIRNGVLYGLAMRAEGRWSPVGSGPAPLPTSISEPYTLLPWRGGPSPHDGGVLIAIGTHTPAELGIPTGEIPMWDGTTWSSIPKPIGFTSLTTWDADSGGPDSERLIAATTSDILAREADAWVSLSTPAAAVKSFALSWDPDGNGPELPRLIAFTATGFAWRSRDTDWQPMPASFTQTLTNMSVRDPDGDGPGAEWLIAARQLNGSTKEIVRWTGSVWETISTPVIIAGQFSVVDLWDPDGPGPGAPRPVVASGVAIPGDATPYAALVFEQGSWRSLGEFALSSFLRSVRCLLPVPEGLEGIAPGSLLVGGFFDSVDGIPSTATALLRACERQPCAGDIDGDGATSAADFTLLCEHYGTLFGATRAQGDLNGDGAVNSSDFVILAGDFGCAAD